MFSALSVIGKHPSMVIKEKVVHRNPIGYVLRSNIDVIAYGCGAKKAQKLRMSFMFYPSPGIEQSYMSSGF